jgi:AcrR family transcriptional regulator
MRTLGDKGPAIASAIAAADTAIEARGSPALERSSRVGAQPPMLYLPLRPGPHGRERDHEQVLEDQRLRLHGAMVEAVSQLGYPAVTVERLVKLAAVSKRSFYEHFSGKQECFLATLDTVIAELSASVRSGIDRPPAPDERLRALLTECACHVESHPKPIRVCIVEAPAAGPAARARVEAVRAAAQPAFAHAVRSAFGADAPPPLAVSGVAHGVWHLVRSRLLGGEVWQLSSLAEELYAWLRSYRCSPGALGATPRLVPARPLAAPCEPIAGDARRRLHRAALELAGRRGLADLSERSLLALARVERAELRRLYEDAHACFLDALGLLAAEALARILAAARATTAGSWPAVVRASLAALLDWLAREPALARAAFVEAFRSGPDTQVRTGYLISGFAGLLRRSAPAAVRPSEVLAEGIVAAVWGVLHDYVASGSIDRLGQLTDQLSYIVLAPTIGAQSAIEELRRPAPRALG